MYSTPEREYLESARVARFATANANGDPHVIPICFALVDESIVTALDEKPQTVGPSELRRVRDIEENHRVALVADQYSEHWEELGWVQVRGTATIVSPGESSHESGVTTLRSKYAQYESQALEERPLIEITPTTVRSWGTLEPIES